MNPLVLWIDTRENLTHQEKVDLFLMIESHIIRRYICRSESKSFSTNVANILSKMHKQKDNIAEVLKDFLGNSNY